MSEVSQLKPVLFSFNFNLIYSHLIKNAIALFYIFFIYFLFRFSFCCLYILYTYMQNKYLYIIVADSTSCLR